MCNNYGNDPGLIEWADAFERFLGLHLALPAGAAEGGSNLTWRTDMYPGYQGLFVRPADPADPAGGLEPAVGRWGLVPWFFKKPLKEWKAATNNARSETMASTPAFRDAFKGARCIIPALSFCEHTGPKGSKTKHRITRADGGPHFLAGLWGRADLPDGPIESYTMVMMDALEGDDMHRFHTRQPVALDRESARTWLDLGADVAPLLRAHTPGSLAFDPPDPVPA